MKITLKNKELQSTIQFLANMPIINKNKDSRCRTKMKKQVQIAFDELVQEEKELMRKYDLLDESGKLIDPGKRIEEKVSEFNKAQVELYDEEVVIEGGMFAKNFDEMKRILEETEMTLSGKDADIYDLLLDQMEEQAEIKEAAKEEKKAKKAKGDK